MVHLLEVRDLGVTYGAVVAVDGVSLTLEAGQIVGLIGPNGAGKSSFIDGLTGAVPGRTGRVMFDGQSLDGLPPHRVARRGLVRTFQSVELFDDLSVRENLHVAAEQPTIWQMLRDLVVPSRLQHEDDVEWVSEVCDLAGSLDRMPGELSHGQRKLVGVARSLARRPPLILMDEPAAGLDTEESAAFGQKLASLPSHGVSVLLIDHDMELVLSVCDRIYVIDFGRLIAEGTPEQIRTNPAVIEAYLGGQHAAS